LGMRSSDEIGPVFYDQECFMKHLWQGPSSSPAGASGLGEGSARMLAREGGKVVIADLQADKGEALAQELGGSFVKCDVTSEADGQAVVAQARSIGKLAGLVNCAGIAPSAKTVGQGWRP